MCLKNELYYEKQLYTSFVNADNVMCSLVEGILSIDKIDIKQYEKCHLVCGSMVAFDENVVRFLNKLSKVDSLLVLLSEVTGGKVRQTHTFVKFPHICTPHLLSSGIALYNIPIANYSYYYLFCESNNLLDVALEFECLNANKLGDGYSYTWTCFAYMFIEKLFNKINPELVILWNQFYPFHRIATRICNKKNIPIMYMEYGVIPGTYSLDACGQMGESIYAKQCIREQSRQIDDYDIGIAREVINYCRERKTNRYKQPNTLPITTLLKNFDQSKKTIVFWGQNDEESGLVPYSKDSKKYHSQYYRSSIEAVHDLKKIADRLGFNFVYKPHPTWVNRNLNVLNKVKMNFPDINLLINVDVNELVDFADLNVTIESQMSYICLIRNRPLLLLGKNQLKNKECCYYKKSKIKKRLICKAIKKGFSLKQKENFEKHVAYMIKNCLYFDYSNHGKMIGKELYKFYEDYCDYANKTKK